MEEFSSESLNGFMTGSPEGLKQSNGVPGDVPHGISGGVADRSFEGLTVATPAGIPYIIPGAILSGILGAVPAVPEGSIYFFPRKNSRNDGVPCGVTVGIPGCILDGIP